MNVAYTVAGLGAFSNTADRPAESRAEQVHPTAYNPPPCPHHLCLLSPRGLVPGESSRAASLHARQMQMRAS